MKDSLRKLILEKAFNEAGKLPSEEELARQLAVSRIAIHKALTDLGQGGLLLRIHGRGTLANPAARQVKANLSGMLESGPVINGGGHRPEYGLVSADEGGIPASVREHLGTGKGDRNIRVEKLYPIDDIPAIINVGRIPSYLLPETPARTDWQGKSNFEIIQGYIGRVVAQDRIEVSPLSAQEVGGMLGHPCPLRVASVLMIQAVGYDQNSEPVIHGAALYDTSHIRFNLLHHAER